MRTIEIDFEVHKLIEAERKSFPETPNVVLRRLLKLGAPIESHATGSGSNASNGAWTGKGVTLPAGTALRMEYRGREHQGIIEGSAWVVEGRLFKSPSAAAGGVAVTKRGNRPSLDGWKYWHVKRPDDATWVSLGALRLRAADA